jgi:hypothetical protein
MSTIPKKWKVRITEDNREVLEQWRIKQPNVDENPKITCLVPMALNYWLISDKYDGSYMNWGGGDRYQEITFEEFKKYVLMEQPEIELNPKFKVGDKVIIKKDSGGYGTGGWRGEFQYIIQTQGYLTISQEYANQYGTQIIKFEESMYEASSRWLTLCTETKTEMKTYNIKISDLKKIHDVACDSWKTKIKSLIPVPFAESIELSQTQVDEMFKAATTDQRPVLVSVFGEPVSYKKGQLLWVWDNDMKYPNVREFINKEGLYFVSVGIHGIGTCSWDNAAPLTNGQLPDQFKHLLDNQ